MKAWLGILTVVCFVGTPRLPAAAQEDKKEREETLDDELDDLKEDDSPDLVGADEDSELMDEFALLEEELSDNEVESASKHRQSIFWSPSAITVITYEEIRSSGALTLHDILRRVPNFDIYELKSSYPLVGARTLTEEGNNLILVLVDDREILLELSGFTLWAALPININLVERIEVIRGPGSALYGSNAFAAVVNITTVSDNPASYQDVFLSFGEQGYYYLLGRVCDYINLGDGVLSFNLDLGTEGKRSPSDFRNKILNSSRAYGLVRYLEGQSLDLSLHVGVLEGDGSFFTYIGDMRISNALNLWAMGKAGFALGETARLKVQVSYSEYDCDFHSRIRLQAFNVWVADVPEVTWNEQNLDTQLQLDWQLHSSLLFISGVNLRYSDLDSTGIFASDDDELRGAVFVHFKWSPLYALQLTGGTRFDFRMDDGRVAVSPRTVAVFRPFSNHAFRLGYGLAFRKPSLYESRIHAHIEKFNPATPEIVELAKHQLGNEDLLNEEVHSIEAGWRGHFLEDALYTCIDLFVNIYENPISIVIDVPSRLGLPDISNSTLQYQNATGKTYAVGGEAELSYRPDDEWTLWGNLGVRHVIRGGERLPSEEQLRANLGARFLPITGMTADISFQYVSAYTIALMDPVNPLENSEPFELGNNLLLIGRVGYRFDVGGERTLEAGLLMRTPIGKPFREYPGAHIQRTALSLTSSDWGGEKLVRVAQFYLSGSF